MEQIRDYPKCKMNHDPTATKARQVIAAWLRPTPDDWQYSKEIHASIFDALREFMRFAQYIGAIDPACQSILYLHSFKVQRSIKYVKPESECGS